MLNIKKLVFGTILELLLTAGLLALFSAFILKMGRLPNTWAGTLAAAAGGIAIFAASFLTAHWVGEKGLLHGLALSGIYAVIYAAVSLLLYNSIQPLPLIVRTAIFLLCGALGGILGVGRTAKVKF